MNVEEVIRKEFKTLKQEMLRAIREEIVLKVKEEVKSEIIVSVVKKIEESHDRMLEALRQNTDEIVQLRESLEVGNLQTHNLLSNIAEILNKQTMKKRTPKI